MHTGVNRFFSYLSTYPLVLVVLIGSTLYATTLLVPVEFKQTVLAPVGDGDRVFIGGSSSVSQSFPGQFGMDEIDVMVGPEAASGPLILHIRTSYAGPDIRSAAIFKYSGGLAKFHFRPILKPTQQYMWILEAPHSLPKTFWVYREQDSAAFSAGRAAIGLRPVKGNFGFVLVRHLPRIIFMTSGKMAVPGSDKLATLAPWTEHIFVAACLLWLLYYFWQRHKFISISVPGWLLMWLVILSAALAHVAASSSLPVIIDEGSYIQDVQQTTIHVWPFRDFLTKGPFYLLMLKVWQQLIPSTLLMWRLFSIVAWSAALYLMWQLTAEFKLSARARVFTMVAFGLMPAAVWLTTPLLLQVASVPFTLAGLLAIMVAVRRQQMSLVAAAALLMNIAFFTRITSAVAAVIGALLIILLTSGRERWRLLGVYVVTGLVLFGIIFGVAAAVLGLDKTAIMFNMEAFIIAQDRSDLAQAQAASEPIIRQLVVQAALLWQGGLPYMMAIFLLPALWLPRHKALAIGMIAALFGILGLVFFHLIDTNFLLPTTLPLVQATIFWLVGICPVFVALAQLLYGRSDAAKKTQGRLTLLAAIWLLLLVLAYAHWGRFIANYLVEFLPPLALLVGLVGDGLLLASKTWQPRWLTRALLSLTGIALLSSWGQGLWLMNKYPFTGTVDASSLQAIVQEVWRHVPARTAIFTAEPIVTSFAARPIVFAYSHPGWYREAFLHTLPWSLVRILFKDPAEVTAYLRDQAQFVLLDKRTNEIYFDQYPERRAILQQDFSQVAAVHNDAAGDTFELYQRNGQ